MATSNDTITLIIRTANNKYADFNLELPLLLTVYDLKQKITLNHPTKPIPKDQRLIFSGKLLDDTSLLSQVFVKATTGSSFMVHLVLDSDKNATTPKIPRSSPSVPEQPKPSEKAAPTPPSSTYEQYLQELNKYQQQLHQFVSNPIGYTPTPNYETQAYLQYCYTHYQMYQNLLDYQRTVTPGMTILNQSSPNIGVNPTTSAAPPPAPAVAAAAAAQPAAGNNNEVEQENDLLGVLNMLVELFVLCSIIYFYSTFSRFLLVFIFFTVLYLHCRGYLSIQRRRRAQVQPAPAAAAAPEQAAENDGEDDNENEPAANEAQNQNDIQRQRSSTPPRAPVVDNQVTTSRLLMTAVSSFFSSLIPERPQRA